MMRNDRPFTSRTARTAAWTVALVTLAACAAPDPFPGAGSEPPPGRLSDDLLHRPDLQAVVEATLARNGGALMGFLEDPDPAVRARAAYGLGSVQDPAARPLLTEALMDPDSRVREDAAFALGQLEGGAGPEAVQALRREGDPRVARALIEALGKQGGAAEMDALLQVDDAALLPAATLALSRGIIREVAPEHIADTLVARMRHEDPGVRRAATYFMARLQSPELWWARRDPVLDALASYERDDEAAMYVLAGLGRSRSVFTQPVAVDWLQTSPDWRIRANAAVAVGALYDVRIEAGPVLVQALDDPSHHVRQRAGEALAPAPPLPSVAQGVVERVRARPGDVPMASAVLPVLVRSGELEVVRLYMEALGPDDGPAWGAVFEAFREIPASIALAELAWIVTAPNAPLETSVRAATQLTERWALVRHLDAAQDAYFSVVMSLVPEADPERVLPLAEILADSVMLDRGSRETLEAFLDRVPQGSARDTLLRHLALSSDERARSLVDPERVAVIEAEVRAAAADAEARTGPADAADPGQEGGGSEAPESDPVLAVDWEALRALGPRPRLVLETEKGRVVVVLRAEEAPLTVQAVAALAAEGRYDDVPFHRVIPNFVVQGGDVSAGDGSGGPGFVLRSEFTRTPFLRGVVGMASSGKDTEGSQYFIDHSPQWHLDGGYTAFGWVERGMDVVDRLERGDRVIRASVVPSM